MTINEIYDDVDNIRITEFMDAINHKPVKQEGNILTYDAPYSILELLVNYNIDTMGKPTCLVDTVRNVWRDKNYTPWQPLTMLMLEISGNYHLNKNKVMIAEIIYEHRTKQAEAKHESQTEKTKPKQEVVKPKRKMRF